MSTEDAKTGHGVRPGEEGLGQVKKPRNSFEAAMERRKVEAAYAKLLDRDDRFIGMRRDAVRWGKKDSV